MKDQLFDIEKEQEDEIARLVELRPKNYYILFFILEGYTFAYDTKTPIQCYHRIKELHPNLHFVHIASFSEERSVRIICREVRQDRQLDMPNIPGPVHAEYIQKKADNTYQPGPTN